MKTISNAIKILSSGLRRADTNRNFYASIRPTDTFLVTYPKSGTTWMGFALANVINQKFNKDLHLRNYIDIVPDINTPYFTQKSFSQYDYLDSPRVLTTHAPYDSAFPKVIYVLRDPRDVLVSYWHHKKLTDPTFGLVLREFLLKDDHWPCNWDEHVSGWLLEQHPNVISVRYEEMHTDARLVLARVCDFVGLHYDAMIIQTAIEASRFENMRRLEERHGVDGANGSQKERFIRKGKIGSWRDELDNECLEILEQKYGAVMKQIGYEPVTLQY
jgi:estrone sulfotransferase